MPPTSKKLKGQIGLGLIVFPTSYPTHPQAPPFSLDLDSL